MSNQLSDLIPRLVAIKSREMSERHEEEVRQNNNKREASIKNETVVTNFFTFFEYAHPDYKHVNPYKREFKKLIDDMEKIDTQKRVTIIFQMYICFLKSESRKIIKDSWLKNKPHNVTVDSFTDL